ncbi:MAG: 4Fe-4S binding protein [Acidobacteriota bacterium]|nr:4Fe-4S binding protein [Acidobacteriota bacterium]
MILPVLLALVLGPVFCSWICPWGLISEVLDKLPGRRPRAGTRPAGRLRWLWLAGVLAASAGLGLPLAALISAPRLITQLPLEILYLGGATVGTVVLLVVLLVLEIVLPRRTWCRLLCPVGSVLVLIRLPWTLTVGWQAQTCRPGLQGTNCVKACSWRLDPRHLRPYDGCTNCGACIEGCPTSPGSLRFRSHRS